MSDRDELARDLGANPPYHCVDCLQDVRYPITERVDVDALWSAGWRKKPSREEIAEAVENSNAWTVQFWSLAVADAVLALLDGPTETGENNAR